jgi:hypothetical protein
MRLETYYSTMKILIIRMKVFSAFLSSISGSVSYFSILGSSKSREREIKKLFCSIKELTREIEREYLDLTRFFIFFIDLAGFFFVFFSVNFSIFVFAFPRSVFSFI